MQGVDDAAAEGHSHAMIHAESRSELTMAVIDLTKDNFDDVVAAKEMVLVDFWAPWCGPCRMMAPAFHKAAALLEPRLRLAKVNTEDVPDLAARFGIRGIPTMILFAGGREVARQSGALTAPDGIAAWARAHLPA